MIRRQVHGAPLVLWSALFFLVPLAYNPFSRWQYEPDKVALALAITGLLAGGAIRRGNWPRLAGSRVEWWIAAYLAVRWLSSAGSIAPEWSLWGDPAWRNGLWLVLAGAVLFMLARRQFITPESRERAITVILLGSAVVAACGVTQVFNPLARENVVRASGTMAHANLLAAYLAMVMPLALARLATGHRRTWIAGLLALHTACLIVTYSRAGWLAAMSGVAVFGLARLWIGGQRRAASWLAGAVIAGLVLLLVLSMMPPLPGDAPHPLHTITTMFRWKGATAQIRLLGWEASLDAIRARPWLGYGPATFRFVIERFMPPELARYHGGPALGGHAHNIPLEVAVESGLIGLAAYLSMLGAVVVPLARFLVRGEDTRSRIFLAGIVAALVANLVNGLFSFDSTATVILFWGLAGMAHAGVYPVPAGSARPSRLGWIAAVAGLVLAGWIVVPDVLARRGETLAAQGCWGQSAHWLARASDLAPVPDVFLAALANSAAEQAVQTGNEAAWLRGAAVWARLVSQRPHAADYRQKQGMYYRRWHAQAGGSDVATQAVDAFTTAIDLSPRNPDLWLDRGLMRAQAGDLPGALVDLERANVLLPNYVRYYGAMAFVALAQGDMAAAEEWNARAQQVQRDWDAQVWRR